MAIAVGSIYALIFYGAGILAWLGLGSMLAWCDLWQLYINTAVAVELTFTTMLLQNTRQHHSAYIEQCVEAIAVADSDIEGKLRHLTGDC